MYQRILLRNSTSQNTFLFFFQSQLAVFQDLRDVIWEKELGPTSWKNVKKHGVRIGACPTPQHRSSFTPPRLQLKSVSVLQLVNVIDTSYNLSYSERESKTILNRLSFCRDVVRRPRGGVGLGPDTLQLSGGTDVVEST